MSTRTCFLFTILFWVYHPVLTFELSASHDILRLYDTQADLSSKHTKVPFLIVPGHRTGVVSQLYLDRACRFMLSAGGNRGWEGLSTEVLLGYEITSMQQ